MFLIALVKCTVAGVLCGMFTLQRISHHCQTLGRHVKFPHMYTLTYMHFNFVWVPLNLAQPGYFKKYIQENVTSKLTSAYIPKKTPFCLQFDIGALAAS